MKTYNKSYDKALEKHFSPLDHEFVQIEPRTFRLGGRKSKCFLVIRGGRKFFEPRIPGKKKSSP